LGFQESIIGFRADPILLLSVPKAIESLTAHLSARFVDELEANVREFPQGENLASTSHESRIVRKHKVDFDDGVAGIA
jgi:hypothetical protein